jgi:hypothetical protein
MYSEMMCRDTMDKVDDVQRDESLPHSALSFGLSAVLVQA